MSIINKTEAELDKYTYRKYLKYGKLNQGDLRSAMDPAFNEVNKMLGSGASTEQDIKVGDNATAGPDPVMQFHIARLKSGTGEVVRFTRKWHDIHTWAFVNEKIDFQTQHKGAAYREIDEKLRENKKAIIRALNRDFWGNSTGLIGKATAVSGKTLTLPTNAMPFLTKDQAIWLNQDESTGTGKRWSSESNDGDGSIAANTFFISKIDYRTNKITLDKTPTHIGDTATGFTAAEAYVFLPGMVGASRHKGILSYVPSSIVAGENFLGVDRSKNPSILAGYYKAVSYNSSSSGFDYADMLYDDLLDCTDAIEGVPNGADNKLGGIWCNYVSINHLLKSKLFKENIRWQGNENRQDAKVGFRRPVFVTAKGSEIPLKLSNCIGDHEFVGLNLDDWDWSYLGAKKGDFLQFANKDGMIWKYDESDKYYKARILNYSNTMTKKPSNLFRLKITYS